MKTKDLTATFKEIFDTRGATPAGALLTWVEVDGRFATGIGRFHDDAKAPRASMAYGSMVLKEKWLTAKEAVASLSEQIEGRGNPLSFGRFFPEPHGERRVASFERFTSWPEWVIAARCDDQKGGSPIIPGRPAVAHGLPPFDSCHRAANDWLFGPGDGTSVGDVRHNRELILVVPDTRGFIASVKWEGDQLVAVVETRGSRDELELQGVLDTDRGRLLLKSQRPAPASFAWLTPENARFADVFLVHSSQELMGHTRVNPGSRVRTQEEQLTAGEQATLDLANGETDRVEYKPFFELTGAKATEFVHSAVAFANTAGGRIYVGADKNGQTEGEGALIKIVQNTRPEPIEEYRLALERLVRERVKPVPRAKAEVVHVAGDRLFRVSIEHGSERPYSTNPGNDVFIRKGSSNKHPDPHTELPGLYPSGAPTWGLENDLFNT